MTLWLPSQSIWRLSAPFHSQVSSAPQMPSPQVESTQLLQLMPLGAMRELLLQRILVFIAWFHSQVSLASQTWLPHAGGVCVLIIGRSTTNLSCCALVRVARAIMP